jgi:hypothetical protein
MSQQMRVALKRAQLEPHDQNLDAYQALCALGVKEAV